MWRKILLMNVLMGISASLLSAQKISTDFCCPYRNTARIAQSLITMYGDSCVAQMLDNNVQFVAIWKLDTLNHVVRLEYGRSRNENDKKEVKKMIDELTDFLKEYQVLIEMCYAHEVYVIKDYIEQEMREGKEEISTNIIFPGILLGFYASQQKSACEQGINLTRLDYVKQHIKKYLPDGLQPDR